MVAAFVLIGLFLGSGPSGNQAVSDRQLFDRARSAFRDGMRLEGQPGQARAQFAKAASEYDDLRSRGFQSAALFRNQGDAYFLAGDVPHSILAYRRGLQLDPEDEQLHAHLARARTEAHTRSGDFGQPPELRGRFHVPLRQAMTFGLLSYYSCWIALAAWWMTRRSWLLAGSLLLGALSALPLGRLALEQQFRADEKESPLVVVSKDKVELRSGNGNSYPPRYAQALSRGVEARCLYQRNGWLQIELAGGEVGWIPREAALVDAP
jgi:hypothetical protein